MAKSLQPDRKTKKILVDLENLSPGLLQVKVRWFFEAGRLETAWHAAALLVRSRADEAGLALWRAIHAAWFDQALSRGDSARCQELLGQVAPGMDARFHHTGAVQLALKTTPTRLPPAWLAGLDGSAGLPAGVARRLEARFAANFLWFHPEQKVPQEAAVFAVRLEAARRALAAFCGGDAPAARTALKALPFDSGFRDLALVLKAGLAADQNNRLPEVARRLATDSPFLPLWRVVVAARQPVTSLLVWEGRPAYERRLIAGLNGLDERDYGLLVCLRDETLAPEARLKALIPFHRELTQRDPDAAARVAHFAVQWLPLIAPDPACDAYWPRHERECLLVSAKRAEETRDRFGAAALWFELADHPENASSLDRRVAVKHGLTLLLEMERGGFDCLSFGFDVWPRLEHCVAEAPDEQDTWHLLLDWLAADVHPGPRVCRWLTRVCEEQVDSAPIMRKAWGLARHVADTDLLCRIALALASLEPAARDVRTHLIGRLQQVLVATEDPAERIKLLAAFDQCARAHLDRALFYLYDHHFNPTTEPAPLDWREKLTPLRGRATHMMRWLHQAARLGKAPDWPELDFDALGECIAWRPDAAELQQFLDDWSAWEDPELHEPLMTLAAKAWAPAMAATEEDGRLAASWVQLVETALELDWLSLADQLLKHRGDVNHACVCLLQGRLLLAQGKRVPPALLQRLDDSLFEAVAHDETELAGRIEHFFALLEEHGDG
ncbi:hypothetical protein [Acanthopleuribacter pedis]|uniref:Uncharacterized protein n=1 Tax=Acanthopleuribacter pedis TaxID=442870 RepID=A0A8J7QGH1_9BACT|nr:hypothetical protein [Acanthopleuribacter pedis]MBO1318203.1 hypothetical protein [Acanthopleuribacter pedis]